MSHLSLFELNALIKRTLEGNMETSYWVVAEIGEMRLHQKGHCYMELVEKEGNFISAKIKANIWAYAYRTLSGSFESITKTPLKAGLKVLLKVTIQFHEIYGLSLNVKDIDPNFTLGERARKRQETIQKLIDAGIYDLNKKLTLPKVPQRIAIISSESAAGYGDFISHLTLNPRRLHFDVHLFPATMQGEQAAPSIIEALEDIKTRVNSFDLVIVIRGGGAQLDLDCFDDFELSAQVAQFPIPVITGIGHERDETVTDLVAHTKMKTPTAVADFLVSGLEHFDNLLDESAFKIHQKVEQLFLTSDHHLVSLTSELKFQINHKLHEYNGLLDRKGDIFKYQAKHSLQKNQQKLAETTEALHNKSSLYLTNQNQRLSNFEKQFSLVEPSKILKRGYSISRLNGTLLMNAKPKDGDAITTVYEDGEIVSTINNKKG